MPATSDMVMAPPAALGPTVARQHRRPYPDQEAGPAAWSAGRTGRRHHQLRFRTWTIAPTGGAAEKRSAQMTTDEQLTYAVRSCPSVFGINHRNQQRRTTSNDSSSPPPRCRAASSRSNAKAAELLRDWRSIDRLSARRHYIEDVYGIISGSAEINSHFSVPSSWTLIPPRQL